MYKELVVSIIIVVVIFFTDFITQNYTKNSINYLKDELGNLRQSLEEKNDEELQDRLNKIDENIEEIHKKLAYYIEHNELEKAETDYEMCKSFTKTKNYDLAIGELDKTVFVLNHITEKYSFNLENIF